MIPIKDKIYRIHYIDEKDSALSYIGKGAFTGYTETTEEGCLFHFVIEKIPEDGYTCCALFSEKDIIEQIYK